MKLAATPEETNVNTIQKQDFPVHSWYRFVLSFPPHLVTKYLDKFEANRSDLVFDPFCGTGTTLVESMKRGFRTVGCDAHPFAALVSRVKTTWNVDLSELHKAAQSLRRRIDRQSEKIFAGGTVSYVNGYQFGEHEEKLLPTGFLSPRPQLKLLLLRDEIFDAGFTTEAMEFFLVALAHTIANGAGNFAFGPEIYRTRPIDDYDVMGHFFNRVASMLNDLASVQNLGLNEVKANVFNDDARTMEQVPSGITKLITSPPYPNEKDYTRTTRVEALLLKVFTDKAGLRQVKESLLRSNTRNIFVKDTDGVHVAEFESIREICAEIEARRIELNKTSGFEKLYHKVVSHYFGGMRRHFRSLKPKLRRGAKLGYVVGDQMSFLMVKIPTAALLAEIAEAEGYRVQGIDLWRERVGTKVRNSRLNEKTVRVREEVLLLENA